MTKVTILAIDRAEYELGRASKKLALEHGLEINAFMIVNHEFKKSPAYRGDETDGYFTEIICDFDETEKLREILNEITANTQVVLHCRMEEAVKDYKKVIPLIPDVIAQTVEALSLSTEKYKMREAMSAIYPEICPKFVSLENYDDFTESMISDFKFPVIVKPNGLHSSFLVEKCIDINDLRAKLKIAFEEIEFVYGREYGTGKISMLIEELIVGKMYSVDSYIDEKSTVYHLPPIRVIPSAEVGLDGFYCYRTKTSIPELSQLDIDNAEACVEKCIQAVGLTSSTTHTELYNTEAGWKIIEIAPRIGGGRQALYSCAYGVDHYFNDLLIHLGKKPDISPKKHNFAGGFSIYADKEGLIKSISGFEEAKRLESAFQLDLNTKVGEKSIFASKGGAFLAEGAFSNENEQKLEEDIALMRDLLQFSIE